MPPKRSKKPSTTTQSTGTQTENDETNAQIQINLLKKELADFKQQVISLQSEINILKSKNSDTLDHDTVKIDLLGKNALKIRNEKISSPRSGSKIVKGCSCKGNCSNKICGCVKKGIPCREFCRCNDAQCQNQEPDKENVEQTALNEDGQSALEKLGRLTLNQEVLHASQKKAKRSSIFSPYIDSNHRNEITNAERIPASPLSFETRRRLLFTQESDDLVDVGSDHDQEDVLATEPKHLEKDPEDNQKNLKKPQIQSIHTPISKRTRKLKPAEDNLEAVTDDDNLVRFTKASEAEEGKTDQNVEQSKIQEKEINKNIEQSRNIPSIQITQNNEKNDDVFIPEVEEKVVQLPRVLRKKSKSVSPEKYVSKRNYNKKTTKNVKSRSVSPNECVNYSENNEQVQPKLGRVQHSPQPLRHQFKHISDEYSNIDNTEIHKSKLIQSAEVPIKTHNLIQSNLNTNFLSNESNISGSRSSSQDILDVSLNPMIPKRQLPRSPINTLGTVIETKRFSPPKKELAVAEVDWEQHQSELVMCKRCKRKFFPHRIEKHMTSCKGI